MVSVLLDKAHGELLSSQADPEKDLETDAWALLDGELHALGMTVVSRTDARGDEMLSDCRVT